MAWESDIAVVSESSGRSWTVARTLNGALGVDVAAMVQGEWAKHLEGMHGVRVLRGPAHRGLIASLSRRTKLGGWAFGEEVVLLSPEVRNTCVALAQTDRAQAFRSTVFGRPTAPAVQMVLNLPDIQPVPIHEPKTVEQPSAPTAARLKEIRIAAKDAARMAQDPQVNEQTREELANAAAEAQLMVLRNLQAA